MSAANADIAYPGGGTWQYGQTYTGGAGGHECYSYYHHPSLYHGAYAKVGASGGYYVYADGGQWAYNGQYGNNEDTCNYAWTT